MTKPRAHRARAKDSKVNKPIKRLPAPTHAETAEKILKYLAEYEQEDPVTQPLKAAWEHANSSRGWK